MKKSVILGILIIMVSLRGAGAPDSRTDILNDPRLSGSNLCAYPYPEKPLPVLSAAPDGFVPFHIEHYGRHGSRWLLSDHAYTYPLRDLEAANATGKLTDTGKEVLSRLRTIEKDAQFHYGDLTELGARQHTGIANRMYHNFPEVFADSAEIDARSTIVIRCILSMSSELQEFARLNPQLSITHDSSKAYQWYLQNSDRDTAAHAVRRAADHYIRAFRERHTNPDRLMKVLFNDPQYVKTTIDKQDLFNRLFEIANNTQSHDGDPYLYSIFTNDELYEQWLCNNASWYLGSAASPLTAGRMPFTQRYLLTNIIESAERAIHSGKNGATLRFGHESVLMPLAAFMELDNCGAEIEDLEDVAASWQNYNIYPMASNVQMIFYRNAEGTVIVKTLLNEAETVMPGKPYQGCYYLWDDLKKYYKEKIDSFTTRFKA